MKILALETSGTSGSIALWTGHETAAPMQWQLPADVRSARSLAPAIQQALAETGWQAREIELLAVTVGPGSFTGLRVGVATAKTFAYAVGCPVIGVNTLEVIARQSLSRDRPMAAVVMDAQRNELLVSRWSCDPAVKPTFVESEAMRILPAEAWLTGLPTGQTVTGPGLSRWGARIPQRVCVVESSFWHPMAVTVARAGFESFQDRPDKSQFEPFALAPQYFRRTAAEEQWDKRQQLSQPETN